MKRVTVNQLEAVNYPVNYLYQAISIYLRKTQVVNRKLSCSANILFLKLNISSCDSQIITNFLVNVKESASNQPEDIKTQITSLGIEFCDCDLNDLKHFDESSDGIYLSIDRFIPRSLEKFTISHIITFIDTKQVSVTFHPLDNEKHNKLLPSIVYRISFSNETKKLELFVDENSSEDSSSWLKYVLMKKIQNWMESCGSNDDNLNIESHQLINSEVYNETYAELKERYGRKLEENWNESTDPKKFIYEDIAIASYLIVLWKQERKESVKLQSFVDLGCGNGLLVYILSQEGHRGFGIDLRKRKIWDQFPKETDLREIAIVPSDENLFPESDWVIGNHSDELSPWIPVICARSSYASKYFLLPCCAFEFSGAKFQRKGSKSQYLSFMDYLLTVSDACGFDDTKMDRLKIPSTKRICLIGSARNYDESEFQSQCEKIQNFINESSTQGTKDVWSESFKPREKIEAVKNCSTIDRSLTETIVRRIFDNLLARKQSFSDEYPEWNFGDTVSLKEAVNLVSSEELKQLKSECGGLQTLLRNKHQIFSVYGGDVRIRMPKKVSEMVFTERSQKRNVIKSSPCYFFLHHPSSCPLDNDNCSYIH